MIMHKYPNSLLTRSTSHAQPCKGPLTIFHPVVRSCWCFLVTLILFYQQTIYLLAFMLHLLWSLVGVSIREVAAFSVVVDVRS